MDTFGSNPRDLNQKQVKYPFGEEMFKYHLRNMETREIGGILLLRISAGGFINYHLKLCYAGECVEVDRSKLEGHWANILENVKDEIRALSNALEFKKFVMWEVKE